MTVKELIAELNKFSSESTMGFGVTSANEPLGTTVSFRGVNTFLNRTHINFETKKAIAGPQAKKSNHLLL